MINKHSDIQNTKENIDWDGPVWYSRVFSNPEATIRLGTSFSGIGAVEHALQLLGLRTTLQFAGDIDANCKKAYMANYNLPESRWHDDIHLLNAKPFRGKIDLFVGGAPCQAFSIRGKRGGFEDTRGTLFSEFARVVIECQPKVFIFENVKGLLSHDKGHTWDVIKRTFEEDCGYQVYFQILNGKDYGIPQSRERIYCIGFKNETQFKYPLPIPLEKETYDFLQTTFDKKYLLKQKGAFFVTRSVNNQKSYTQINGDIILCQKRNQQFNWHGDFIFHPKLKTDKQTPSDDDTLFHIDDYEENYYITNHPERYAISATGKDYMTMHPVQIQDIDVAFGRFRKITPRECLRLMGFDDSFKIVCSDTETYKQSGNSIIVNVLIALLKQMDITKYGI